MGKEEEFHSSGKRREKEVKERCPPTILTFSNGRLSMKIVHQNTRLAGFLFARTDPWRSHPGSLWPVLAEQS